MRPFELLNDDCDPATPLEPSLVPCALSAFFLLLKRNAIVPFEAGNLPVLCQSAPAAVGLRDFQKSFFRLEWKVRGSAVVG